MQEEMIILGTVGFVLGLVALIIILLIGPGPKEHPKILGVLTGIAAVGTTLGAVVFNHDTTLTIILLLAIVCAVARIISDTAKECGK